MPLSDLIPTVLKPKPPKPARHRPQQTSYISNDVPIPADFLSVPLPEDAPAVTLTKLDWSKTALPENGPLYAVVLDNVLTPAECAQLLRMAEASVVTLPDGEGEGGNEDGGKWRPAMVNMGPGWEILEPEYRNSDRIIWDQQEVVDRLWGRCRLAPGLEAQLAGMEGVKRPERELETRWVFKRFNKRMRFLKYQKGQFFRPHCDGPYGEEAEDGTVIRTHYTVHLYLNDSVAEVGTEGGADLVGGATSFLSSDEKRKVDVDPKAGRVLIFQHSRLYHSGDDVVAGTKYTMRTDILYEMVKTKTRGEEGTTA
ncbi:oxidoreductase domain-containing protein [Colletotrichum orchidophilum]|uniref:Oxidoreductase domain-containing protein n=1 Tax=Colletotrichum orchidophilum TaxID=1209926 RepID=A0A1G4B783_9PEZI|nr:oxidoreductase domain-containing protein [Colletotrichum orchidophilum]OHE97196.1 oxidoreductase domain-containing protein [Colletotrichum orchidophilum]